MVSLSVAGIISVKLNHGMATGHQQGDTWRAFEVTTPEEQATEYRIAHQRMGLLLLQFEVLKLRRASVFSFICFLVFL